MEGDASCVYRRVISLPLDCGVKEGRPTGYDGLLGRSTGMKLQLLQCSEHTRMWTRLNCSTRLCSCLFLLCSCVGFASHENKTLRPTPAIIITTIANLKKLAYRSDTTWGRMYVPVTYVHTCWRSLFCLFSTDCSLGYRHCLGGDR